MLGENFGMRISELEEKTLSESAIFEIEHLGRIMTTGVDS